MPPETVRPLLICGNVNVETVFRLPEETFPTSGGFFAHSLGLNVSGVGANLARALGALGSPVRLLTFGADDDAGRLVRSALKGTDTQFAAASATPQSLAIVGPDGKHQFYRDLKDTPNLPAPKEAFQALLPGCSAALLTNIGWTRDLLPLAQAMGLPILTDVQDIHDLHNAYDAPYFAAADILFLSGVHLSDPEATLHDLSAQSPARMIVAGLGESGALLLERGQPLQHQSAFPVNTVYAGGAGDTLAASFAHFYFTRGLQAREALRLACAAAALKLGASGSGQGHPTEQAVTDLATDGFIRVSRR